MEHKFSRTKKLTISAMMMALYVALVYVTAGFSFGAYQIRLATSMYALSYFFPFLIVPMGLANLLSNFLGGLGLFDIIGGGLVGVVTTSLIYFISKKNLSEWLIILPIIFVPGLIVSTWLSYLLKIPYIAMALSLCIGQIIPAVVGAVGIKLFKNRIIGVMK